MVKSPVNCSLHLSMTNSYNPCLICCGCILHAWERVTFCCKRKTQPYYYDFDVINADQTISTLNPSSKVEACICPKGHDSSSLKHGAGQWNPQTLVKKLLDVIISNTTEAKYTLSTLCYWKHYLLHHQARERETKYSFKCLVLHLNIKKKSWLG